MGGLSIEKEVSFNSGRTVCDHLDTSRYQVVPLFLDETGLLYKLPLRFLHRGKISDFQHKLALQADALAWDELKEQVDFVYLTLHGRYGEDGCIQGTLELLGLPYFASGIFASAVGMHKGVQKTLLAAAGIAVPRGLVLSPHRIACLHSTQLEDVEAELAAQGVSYPLIVKPVQEGSSFGISCVRTQAELYPALQQAACVTPGRQQAVIIEELIEGMEFTCITLYDAQSGTWRALPPTEVAHDAGAVIFDYEQKYMPGRGLKYTPARCTQQELALIQTTAVAATKALGMQTIGRIDGFLARDGRVVVTDPNTLSGMAPTSFLFLQAAQENMNHTDVINYLIQTDLQSKGCAMALETAVSPTQLTDAPKLRVAVLLGGESNERETSLDSGRNVVYKLSPHTYEVMPLFMTMKSELYRIDNRLLVHNTTQEIAHELDRAQRVRWSDLPALCDFVFLGLHGGKGENGAVQGMLETLGLPYNGSGVLASALCMDKYATERYLAARGFAVAQSLLLSRESFEAGDWQEPCAYPLIVKPHDDGCSVLVEKVHTRVEAERAIAAVFAVGKQYALVQECIVGMELTVGVLGNHEPRALPPSQAVAAGGVLSMQEKFLPGAGENQTPAPLTLEHLQLVQQQIERAYESLELRGYARIDCFFQSAAQSPTGSERVVMLEVNTLPALTPATCLFHQAAEIGMSPMQVIDTIVQLGLEEHGAARIAKCSLPATRENI